MAETADEQPASMAEPADQPRAPIAEPADEPAALTAKPTDEPAALMAKPTDEPATPMAQPANEAAAPTAQSADEPAAPTADDNLLTRHQHIAESIETIRLKKDQLLRTLRGLSQSENPDRALMAKLIEAFDMMTAQETAFLGVLKNIVDIHEQATKDLAAEQQAVEQSAEEKEESGDKKESTEEVAENPEEDYENDTEMIKETLLELEKVSMQALAAAELNEKLVESLQRHKKSRTSILEMRKSKTEELKSAASAAMAEVKKAKQDVSVNRAEIMKKQREAEELRRAALKAGIQVGAEEEKHNQEITAALSAVVNDVERIPPIPVVEEPVEAAAEPEDPLEVRRRQIRENIRKERERKEHVNQTIREKLAAMEARKQRMKEIRRLLAENQAAASSIVAETKKKLEATLSPNKGGESVASDAETNSESKSANDASTTSDSKPESETNGTCSEATTQISLEDCAKDEEQQVSSEDHLGDEELQMDEVEEQTRHEIEETFRSAELNLQNLTLLRQRLEHIQSQGGAGLSQEDQEFLDKLDETAAAVVDGGDDGTRSSDEGRGGGHADYKESA